MVLDGNHDSMKQVVPEITQFLLRAKAEGTTETYLSSLRSFKRWASVENQCWLPTTPMTVIAYINHLSKKRFSRSALQVAKSAIAWLHALSGLPSPTDDKLVGLAVEGATRMAPLPMKTSALPNWVLQKCLAHLLKLDTFCSLRFATLLCFLFYGFLRISEALALKLSDVVVADGAINIYIKKSKTDQLAKGNAVVIAT